MSFSNYFIKSKIKIKLFIFTFLLITSLVFTDRQLQKYFIKPKVIFILGGHEERERFSAKLALKHMNLALLVSSGGPQIYITKIFMNAGINNNRLYLDYRAKDTVTNFVSLIKKLQIQKTKGIYLITSNNHVNRAKTIGEIIFGTQGIISKPFPVPSNTPSEPLDKLIRDVGRSLLWIIQ